MSKSKCLKNGEARMTKGRLERSSPVDGDRRASVSVYTGRRTSVCNGHFKIAARSDQGHERSGGPVAVGAVNAADRLAGDFDCRPTVVRNGREHGGRDVGDYVAEAVDPDELARHAAGLDAPRP